MEDETETAELEKTYARMKRDSGRERLSKLFTEDNYGYGIIQMI